MARLPYADISERLPQLNIFKLMANAETAFKPFMAYGAVLLRELEVDPVVREQAILRVAALTPGAEYEWVQHEAIGRAVGMTDEQVEACRSGDPEDLVLRFTEEVVRDATPSDATFAAMTERFSPREIVELLLVIGQYMMLARVMATAQIDLDEPVGARLIGDGS
jgi:4-carboxymuconolactone decarboxylase